MATTDIDGTPLFMLGPAEVEEMWLGLQTECNLTLEEGYEVHPALAALIEEADKFLAEPQVVKWLKENS